jgi:hypothetical protein
MNKATELYERAVLCHQRSVNCSREAEKKGWFQLASIWLILADRVSAQIEFGPFKEALELTAEEMISPATARPIVSTDRDGVRRAPDQRNAPRPLLSALTST